jgi:hypothetical protein
MDTVLAGLFFVAAIGSVYRAVRFFSQGLREADHPSGSASIVRGIRALIIALAMGAFGGGLLFGNVGLMIFGAIFLGEELYETGVVLLALKRGQRR